MQPQVVAPPVPARAGRFTARKAAVIAVFAAAAGAAVMLQIRGWSTLESESGGACGTSDAGSAFGACPRGTAPVLIVSFLVGFVSVPFTIWAIVRRPRVGIPVAAIGLAAGVFAGQALFGWWHGTDLRVDWTAPYDSSGKLTTEGVWTTGGSLVRVRADQIVSYQAATGRQQWTLAVPGLDVACAVSAQAAVQQGTGQQGTGQPGVGLIGYGSDGGSCDHVLAVDLGSGRQLWSKQVAADFKGDQGSGFVAVGGDTAVVVTAGGVLGYDPRTGAPRWTRPAPAGCDDQALAASQRSVVALAACDRGFDVIALDPASGRQLWSTPVPEPVPDYQFAILSADPVVVDDLIPGTRQVEHVLAFGPGGHLDSSILVSDIAAPGGPAALDTSYYQGFGPEVVVSGGLLVGVTQPSGGHSDIVAFRLSDGRRQWLVQMPGDVVTIRGDAGQLLVVDRSVPVPALDAISIPGGSLHAIGFIPRRVFGFADAAVYPVGGRYIVVNLDGLNPVPPVASVSGLSRRYAERPASTGMTAPVRAPESGEQSQAIAAATSSGSRRRRSSAWPAKVSWDGRP